MGLAERLFQGAKTDGEKYQRLLAYIDTHLSKKTYGETLYKAVAAAYEHWASNAIPRYGIDTSLTARASEASVAEPEVQATE